MHPSPSEPRSASGVGAAEADERLIAAARAARAHSYSPYSGVRVGAALLTDDGRIFRGCNVENASYGLTICAERCAVVKAVSEGARRFVAIAIVSNRPGPLSPCGACRQMLSELGAGMRVVCVGDEHGRFAASIEELLPRAFECEDVLAACQSSRQRRPPADSDGCVAGLEAVLDGATAPPPASSSPAPGPRSPREPSATDDSDRLLGPADLDEEPAP